MGFLSYLFIIIIYSEKLSKIMLMLYIIFTFLLLLLLLHYKKNLQRYTLIKKVKEKFLKHNSNYQKIIDNIKYNTEIKKFFFFTIKNFLILHKKGITEIKIIKTNTEKKINYITKNINMHLNRLNHLKSSIFYINVLYLLFITTSSIHNACNAIIIILKIHEIFLITLLNVIIILYIKIITNKFANLNFYIYNEYKTLMIKIILNFTNKFNNKMGR